MIKGYIEHVAIKVINLEWFLDFFTTVLVFEERKREEKEGQISQTWLSSNIAVLQAIRLQDSSIDSVVADFFDCGYQSTKYLVKKDVKK